MTHDLVLIVTGVLMLIGASFAVIAAIGLLRLPDIYTRTHAASKAGTLGSGLLLLSLAVFSQELDVVTRAIAAIVFFLLTAPISSHLLARSAYLVGYRPEPSTRCDDMADYQNDERRNPREVN
ncbi:monovalent cation/H(+) antiporter subunit G [Pararhizobium sp. IMCC21322]|uniref:monovalent cation/H(+) antiporter subunit G n=1 Tax=Pararhizobium sp. IMCC21322 TaxID=3067903 RepID=UPI002741F1BF|nr:monovalent cation/H(+) antiporter subunit G [Pararhizobium sp. IMCC21322]